MKGSETKGLTNILSYAATWEHNCHINWGDTYTFSAVYISE